MKHVITVELDAEMSRLLSSEQASRYPYPRYLVARLATRLGLRLLETYPEILDGEVEEWKENKRKPRRSARKDMMGVLIMARRRRET